MSLYAYSSAWQDVQELWAYDGTTWRDIQEGWVYDGTTWREFWSAESPCSSITSVGQAAYTIKGCLSPKCRHCVWWTLDCACISGQVIDLFVAVGGGSYSLLGSNLSCTAAAACTATGTPDGKYDDSNCNTTQRQYRIELMDTDTTTTLDTAYTANIGCDEV